MNKQEITFCVKCHKMFKSRCYNDFVCTFCKKIKTNICTRCGHIFKFSNCNENNLFCNECSKNHFWK